MATIEERSEHLKTSLNAWVESGAFPGILYGIYDDNGKEIFHHISNDDNHPSDKKYKRDTLFRIYSMTKPITSVAFMILAERGIVNVHDPVSKYIPSFANATVVTGGTADEPILEPLETELTVHHLLTHTSGISYAFFGNSLSDQILRKNCPDYVNWFAFTDLPTLCEKIAQTPLCFQPGSKFHYGLNTDVLGRVVEVASGVSLEEFFRQEIFTPLGMVDTFFQIPTEKLPRLADIYEVATGMGYKSSQHAERDRSRVPIMYAGGGGLTSTLDDYAKFTTCLLRQGAYGTEGKRILKAETVQLMTQNHLRNGGNISGMAFDTSFSEAFGSGYGFGYGFSVILNPALVKGGALSDVGEFGWGGVAATSFYVCPVQKISAIFLTQLIPGAAVYPVRSQTRWLSHWVVCGGKGKKKVAEEESVTAE